MAELIADPRGTSLSRVSAFPALHGDGPVRLGLLGRSDDELAVGLTTAVSSRLHAYRNLHDGGVVAALDDRRVTRLASVSIGVDAQLARGASALDCDGPAVCFAGRGSEGGLTVEVDVEPEAVSAGDHRMVAGNDERGRGGERRFDGDGDRWWSGVRHGI